MLKLLTTILTLATLASSGLYAGASFSIESDALASDPPVNLKLVLDRGTAGDLVSACRQDRFWFQRGVDGIRIYEYAARHEIGFEKLELLLKGHPEFGFNYLQEVVRQNNALKVQQCLTLATQPITTVLALRMAARFGSIPVLCYLLTEENLDAAYHDANFDLPGELGYQASACKTAELYRKPQIRESSPG